MSQLIGKSFNYHNVVFKSKYVTTFCDHSLVKSETSYYTYMPTHFLINQPKHHLTYQCHCVISKPQHLLISPPVLLEKSLNVGKLLG